MYGGWVVRQKSVGVDGFSVLGNLTGFRIREIRRAEGGLISSE